MMLHRADKATVPTPLKLHTRFFTCHAFAS